MSGSGEGLMDEIVADAVEEAKRKGTYKEPVGPQTEQAALLGREIIEDPAGLEMKFTDGTRVTFYPPDKPEDRFADKKVNYLFLPVKLPMGSIVTAKGHHFLVESAINTATAKLHDPRTTYVKRIDLAEYEAAISDKKLEFRDTDNSLPLAKNPENDFFRR